MAALARDKRGNTLAFGEFGLQSLTRGPMTGQQIEAARVTIADVNQSNGVIHVVNAVLVPK